LGQNRIIPPFIAGQYDQNCWDRGLSSWFGEAAKSPTTLIEEKEEVEGRGGWLWVDF